MPNSETILVDASSILCKCALGDTKYQLTTSEGVETTLIYSFMDCLLNLGIKFDTNHIIVIFDSRTNRRKALYPLYKANRKEVPEEIKERRLRMYAQIPALRDFLTSCNIPCIEEEGFESDDIIASFVFNNPDSRFVSVTTDHDMYQTLSNKHRLYNINKDTVFTSYHFNKMFPNLPPRDYWKVLSIAGCTTDNVPGVKGVGERKAYLYLTNALKETSKAYSAIKDNKETVYFTQKLVKLPFEGCPTYTVPDTYPSFEGFINACEKYEFTSFLDVEYLKKITILFSLR